MGLNANPWTTRTPIQFICPQNTTLNITGLTALANNPSMYFIQAGNVGKVDLGLNGTTYFTGDGEYSPFAIQLEWASLGFNDYLKLVALRPYFVSFISFRNLGFYGKLIMDGPKSTAGPTADIVNAKGNFYVLAPSDTGPPTGTQPATINRIAQPDPSTFAIANSGTGNGFIPSGYTNYYWLTYSTIWGETNPTASGLVTSATANTANTVTWVWPTTTAYVSKASLYCASVNDSTQSKLMAELLAGETPTWVDYVGFPGCVITQQPPISNGAFRGYWAGGVWINETP